MTEFWKWSFPEFSWLFLSSLVCFTDVKQPMPLHATKSMPGRNSQRQLAMKQLYAGWVVSRYIGVIHQLAAFPWFWVMLNWMQSLVRHVLKNPHWPWKKMKEVAEMVDPWHGIYHWWWGNAIHSKKQRFGPVRSKSAGALVSRQGNMMVEEGPWWMVMSSFDRVSRNVNYCPWNYGL